MSKFKQWLLRKLQFDINKHTAEKIIEDREQQRKERLADSNRGRRQDLDQFINQPVIVFGNEVMNPVVGYGLDIIQQSEQKTPLLVVHDYVTNSEVLVFGKVFHYHPNILGWYYETDPRLAIYLLYNGYYQLTDNIDQTLEQLFNYNELVEQLTHNKFFEKLYD